MKKQLLFSAALSLLAVAGVQAQDDEQDYKLVSFLMHDYQGEPGVFGVFEKVSPNGKYALGNDNQVGSGARYIWYRDNPEEITFTSGGSMADITNDGMVVGSAFSQEAGRSLPAYKTLDGEWKFLPVPDDYAGGGARAVTPDGKFIMGQFSYSLGEVESPLGGMVEIKHTAPIKWAMNDNGEYEFTDYRNAGEDWLYYDPDENKLVEGPHDVEITSCYMYDISRDGSTIVGQNTAENGCFNPMLIRDGKLIQLFDGGGEKTPTFNGGICHNIDANGNIFGYFQNDDEGTFISFIYTTEGELVYTPTWYICGTADGTRFPQVFGGLSNVMDCSDDGSVIVGGTTESYAGGGVNAPAILYKEDKSSAVDRVEALKGNVGINYSGNVLVVTGKYARADVYNAQGALIATGGQGKAFSMEGQPAGVYIVKVTTADGEKSYKFAR